MAAVTAFLLCMILGPIFINLTKQRRIRESAKRHDAPGLDLVPGQKRRHSHHGRGFYRRQYFVVRRAMGQLVEYVCGHDFLGLPVFRGAGGHR